MGAGGGGASPECDVDGEVLGPPLLAPEVSMGSRVLRCPSLASGTMPSSLHRSSYTWTLSKGSTSRPLLKLGPTARKMVFMSMTPLSKPCSPLLNCTFTLCGGAS